jgi:hypothetical protein
MYPPTTPLARFEKFKVDEDRHGPRHYDDCDLLPHRHKGPLPDKKAGTEAGGEKTGPASPSKLTAHYTPVPPNWITLLRLLYPFANLQRINRTVIIRAQGTMVTPVRLHVRR